jgi:signal transduction histidine kinase
MTRVLAAALFLASLAAIVLALHVLVVLGIGRMPSSEQRTLLAFSMLAAAVTALVFLPVSRRIRAFAARDHGAPGDVLRSFGVGLTRALPLEELLLQLAESLRRALVLDAAEVWAGSGGRLRRAASDPDAGPGELALSTADAAALARAGVRATAWLRVWLPQLVETRGELRAVPVTHARELLGLIVVRRDARPFTEADERILPPVARQVGLVLHNVRLGSELQASHDELRRQADELRASRSRVVAAADAERRRIERDLHDGAQQHLVALAVNLRLARELAESDPRRSRAVLEELSGDVRTAIDEFRDLAHGVYPPLLVAQGLGEGLRSAAARSPLPAKVEARGVGRYPPEVEATLYFCCLEALQNAGKHAGSAARASVRVWEEQDRLLFEVADDGVGFDTDAHPPGAGLTNMSDRLGALGGRLSITSAPGAGTRVAGAVPL